MVPGSNGVPSTPTPGPRWPFSRTSVVPPELLPPILRSAGVTEVIAAPSEGTLGTVLKAEETCGTDASTWFVSVAPLATMLCSSTVSTLVPTGATPLIEVPVTTISVVTSPSSSSGSVCAKAGCAISAIIADEI